MYDRYNVLYFIHLFGMNNSLMYQPDLYFSTIFYLDTSNSFSIYDIMTACEASAQLTSPAGMILVDRALHVCRITIPIGWINGLYSGTKYLILYIFIF